jgi:TPP-dependent pyruvate/acetoin dehydrogenase alpha subunit
VSPWEPPVQVAGTDEPRVLGQSGNGKPESLSEERAPRRAKYRGVPVAELLADYRLALISRFLDDREITLQKQSRGFFHISGAGHEALCLGLARSLRPSYDWFLPYYRDRALVLALGVTPTELLLQAVGAATDPASGGRQNAVPFRVTPAQHLDPIEPDGFAVPPCSWMCRSRSLHLAP